MATRARTAPTVKTTQGRIEGQWIDDLATFLGIPYAEPPVGERRWAPPVPASRWADIRRAHEPGPIAPQLPSRLEAVMGPMQAPDPAEDCLSLNVWSPAPGRGEDRPVLVFLHGGGYLSGAGSAGWYDGAELSRRGDAVVVTLNYRIGALGYLYLSPEVTGAGPVANLGLQDQRLALEWVKENASSFGGDSDNITVFGQSGGAHSILALRATSAAPELFHRAILQSGPFGMPAAQPQDAEKAAAVFLEAAGVTEPGFDQLRALSTGQILKAQGETLGKTFVFGGVEPPFHLVVDGEVLTEEPIALGSEGSLDDIDVLIGFTKHEATPFYCPEEALWSLPLDPLAQRLAEQRGDEAERSLRAYAERSQGVPPATALCDMVGDEFLVAPSLDLAAKRATRGERVHVYRFSWESDAFEGRLGAGHTIELPFVFNNFANWKQAPMLGGAQPGELAELAERVQDAWVAFAATGHPGHAGLPQWDPFTAEDRQVLDLAATCEVIDDPSDGRSPLWAHTSAGD